MNQLFNELKRRNVFRVAAVYAIVAWLLVQVAATLEDALNMPAWFDTVITSTLLLGFPVALLLAWAFELTPEGVKRTEASSDGAGASSDRKLDYAILAGLALVAIAVTANTMMKSGGSSVSSIAQTENGELSGTSIAVLPFVSMSESKDDEFFADGLSEELLNVLTNIDSLKVAARTSSFYYKGKNEDLRTIAEALGVNHVLEGSVRRSGDRLRITAQLINASDGYHLWSETYDRATSDIFAIQDDIARKVSSALKVTLLGAEEIAADAEPEADPEAQGLFLIAQAKLSQRGLENLRSAQRTFQEAIKLDPDFARAHIGYANATLLLSSNHGDIPTAEAIAEAKRAAGIAVGLDPEESDVFATLGQIDSTQAGLDGDPELAQKALANFEQALSLNPRNVQAVYWYAIALESVGETERALSTYEQALSIDPLARVAHYRKGALLMLIGRYDEAENQLFTTLALFPDYIPTRSALSDMEVQRGRLDRAVYWADYAYQSNQQSFMYKMQLAVRLAELGEVDKALQLLEVDAEDTSLQADYFHAIRYAILSDYPALYEVALKFGDQGDKNWAAAAPAAAMINGDFETAQTLFKAAYPALYTDEIIFSPGGLGPEAALAPAYVERRLGNEAQAQKLINALMAAVSSDQSPYYGYRKHGVLSIGYALLDDKKAALREFKKAYDKGYRGGWVSGIAPPESYPLLDNVRSEPAFQTLVSRIEQDLEVQRKDWNSGKTARDIESELKDRGLSI